MTLYQYKDLILYKTFADLRAESAKTYIGVLWWIIDPIIFMLIFYFVFDVLMKRGVPDFVPFLLIGLAAWRWFQGTLVNGSNAILAGRGLFRQVYIPKVVFPLVVIFTDMFKFSVVLAVLLIFLWVYGFPITIFYLAFPFVLLVQFILITGATFFLSGIVPFFPDLKIMVNHVLQLLFFVSGIIFSIDIIPEQYKIYFYINPIANIIQAYRDVLMYQRWPEWIPLLSIAGFSVVLLCLSYLFLAYNEHRYPKLNAG